MPDFRLPDLGEGLDEAEVVTWRVAVGDHVEIDQIVVEVETAKAAVEVPVPFAGIVTQLHAQPGTTVAVGQPLITVTAGEPAAGFREPGAVTPEPAMHAQTDQPGEESSGNVLIGYGTAAAPRRHRHPTRRGPHRAKRPAATPPPVPASISSGPVPVISPLVRKMARDAGVDLTAIAGTGPRGLVRRCDVQQALAQRTPEPQTRGAQQQPEPGERRLPLRGLRRTVADKLARSRREIPDATVWVDVDATALLDARRALNASNPQQPVGLLALLARFTLLGLRRYPELNARIERDEIIIPDHVHLGFAAQTERGLVVPVVHNAHRLSTRDLSAALATHTAAARDGTLSPADLTGGTFTVNNYGVFGVDGSAAVINHPEVAIVGMGRIIDRPWVIDGQLCVRKISQLTLAFDHRVCDGGTAGGFLRYIADCVESPITAIGEI